MNPSSSRMVPGGVVDPKKVRKGFWITVSVSLAIVGVMSAPFLFGSSWPFGLWAVSFGSCTCAAASIRAYQHAVGCAVDKDTPRRVVAMYVLAPLSCVPIIAVGGFSGHPVVAGITASLVLQAAIWYRFVNFKVLLNRSSPCSGAGDDSGEGGG